MCYRKSVLIIVIAALATVLPTLGADAAKGKGKKDSKGDYAMTEAGLQTELMSYADRYASLAAQAIDDVAELQPPREVRNLFNAELIYSAASAYTIAADPNPQVALLDMVVLATLGRMIFEEHWQPRHGSYSDPVVATLKDLEAQVWKIFAGINLQYNSRMINVDEAFIDPLIGNLLLPGFPDYWEEHATDYTILDFRVGWSITEMIRITAILRNALNVEYLGRPGDLGPPRNITLQLRLNL